MRARRPIRLSLLLLTSFVTCEWACAQRIAVITALNAPPVTKSQLAKIYLGKSFDRRPIDLPEGSRLRTDFYRMATDSDMAQVRAIWAKLMFTGRGEPPRELASALAVKKAVAADPEAIGYIDAELADSSVKTVLVLQ